jgi:prepilin-type N-terminal cleavage/methylation domain-containing protein
MKPSCGFTLLELLVVIMVIFILVVIALPNFLEAQLRAKVARSGTEVRSYAVALEAYFIDWRVYPFDQDPLWPLGDPEEHGLTLLTSPIRYFQDLAHDPFGPPTTSHPLRQVSFSAYIGGSGSDNEGCGGRAHYADRMLTRNGPGCVHAYIVDGIGPDRKGDLFLYDTFPGDPRSPFSGFAIQTYSPSNGSRSSGDIYKMVGDWKHGNLLIDQQRP